MAQAISDITRIVNTSILQKLPDAYYEATGLATGIHNLGGELITTIPRESFCAFCRNMFFSREGHRRCVRSNAMGERRSFEIGGTYIYHCHASLVDVSTPIIVNGRHYGSVSCGQILLEPLTDAYRDRVRRRLADFPRDFQQMQMRALEEVPVVPLKRVHGLGQLLSVIANNIVGLIISNTQEKEINLQNAKLLDEIKARSLLEKEIRNAQLLLKEAELKALQAQINPHFLYNTLDSIQWLAVLQGAEDIQKTIQCLGQLLRHSLDRKSVIVNVAKELEQIRSYLFIQKMRYGEKLSYRINLEPAVLDYELPKLVLQPIVENAILHGVEPRPDGGSVLIEGWLHKDDQAIIEITDDGVGMSEEALAQLNASLRASPEGGAPQRLGLANVSKRLAFSFGEEFAMTIRSRPGEGTSVRIRIPRSPRKE
jgi:two-component system, LytTR family, sensor kinase